MLSAQEYDVFIQTNKEHHGKTRSEALSSSTLNLERE